MGSVEPCVKCVVTMRYRDIVVVETVRVAVDSRNSDLKHAHRQSARPSVVKISTVDAGLLNGERGDDRKSKCSRR